MRIQVPSCQVSEKRPPGCVLETIHPPPRSAFRAWFAGSPRESSTGCPDGELLERRAGPVVADAPPDLGGLRPCLGRVGVAAIVGRPGRDPRGRPLGGVRRSDADLVALALVHDDLPPLVGNLLG